MSEYEKIRNKNLQDNKRILAELGLVNPFKPIGRVFKKVVKPKLSYKLPPTSQSKTRPDQAFGSIHGARRKSARIQGKPESELESLGEEEEKEEEEWRHSVKPSPRPNFFGHIHDVEIGTVWLTRVACSRDGIHRPTVAGIHGSLEGAYSIALSGGYDDNIDLGECFTYTGEGGRDLKGTVAKPKNLRTAPQSKDQSLTRGNLALSRSCENGHPVRVIRGYKLDSPFAPEEGYRYDGIYTVEKFWFTTGLSGFGVWKFALRRCEDQAPPPWELLHDVTSEVEPEGGEANQDATSHWDIPDTNNNEKEMSVN